MVESAHKRKEAGIPQTSFPIFPDSFGKEGIANVHYSFVVFNIEKQKIFLSYTTLLSFFPRGATIRDFLLRNPNVFEKKYPSTCAGGKSGISSRRLYRFETLLEAWNMNEIGKTKLPNAGEWWVRNDDGAIVFICGCDPDGDPVFMDDDAELHNSILRFFTQAYHHKPLCTGFDWLPVAEVWPKWIISDHWTDTAFIRRDSADSNSSYTIDGKKRETKNGKPSHAEPSIDSLIANKTWRYATEVEALARVVVDPDDIPLNPVPGKVVATGTVTLTPVQPDDTAAIIAEHTQQVRELTQRIGDLVQQVNKCHAVIEGIRTALHVDFI